MSTNEQTRMLDELEGLLEKQVKLARQGNSASEQIGPLSRQADCLVEKIAQCGILEQPEFESRQRQLQKLYKDLCLAVTAQKADTVEKLRQVRKGKKIVGTYRGNT